MWNNKKGAALMQVLLITAILAGMATMLLRTSLTRTASARKTRRTVSASMLIQSCMAEVNALWASKKVDAYTRDLKGVDDKICMYCKNGSCTAENCITEYSCEQTKPWDNGPTYQVKATIRKDSRGKPQITYEVTDGAGGVADL